MSTSPTDSTKAAPTSARRSTRRSPSPRTSAPSITSPHSTATPSAGILRVSNKPRRASGSSVEFRVPPEQQLQTEPASPQPSVDRLSVSFAADTPGGGGSVSTPGGSGSGSVAQTSPLPATPLPATPLPATPQALTRSACIMGVSGTGRGQRPPPLVLNGTDFKSRLAADTSDLGEEDEDYSASLSAIIQRRTSTLRRSRRRRPSSPFSPGGVPGGMASGVAGGMAAAAVAGTPTAAPAAAGFVATPAATPAARRRSSVFTTSSGETGGSGDTDSQEQIMENLKLHKEVLLGVKQQPWGMRRKLKLVRQAKTYVKRHEGQLQQRRATRDVLARFNLFLLKKWQRFKREFANLLNVLLPWEARIKEIESHFGSVVASYFTFLRWLCWVNLVITVVTIAFIVVPEILTDDFKTAGERKEMLPEERRNATRLVTLWDFGGVLKYSPLFYGYYRNKEGRTGYRVPFAYFMTGLGLYVYSFVAILRKMAANSRMSKLSEKDDECVFTWKLFTGWDYMIGNAETAHNKVASTILGFKEALLEEAEKQREDRNWRIIAARIFVNISVTILLATSAFAVVFAVQRSYDSDAESSVWRRNETTVIINIVNFVFPALFELLGLLERYHPRKTLRLQLARIMLLNLLNLYTFIFSTFNKITDITKELAVLEKDHRNVSLATSCSCTSKGSSSLTTIAAVTLAISAASRINPSTTIMPMTSIPISTWHSPPSLGTTFTALMLTPPSSIPTRNTSTSISSIFTPPNSITTEFTTPASVLTKSTSNAESTYGSSTMGYEGGSTSTTAIDFDDSSTLLTTNEEILSSTQSAELDTSDVSTLEQSLPVNKYRLYDANDKFESSNLQSGQQPSTIPIAALLSGRYLAKRNVESNEVIAEDEYDYYEPAELSTDSPLVTTPWISDDIISSDDPLGADLDEDYPSTISENSTSDTTTTSDYASTGTSTTGETDFADSLSSTTPRYGIYSTSSNIPSTSTTTTTTTARLTVPPTTSAESSTTTTPETEITVPMTPAITTTIQTVSTTAINVTTADISDISAEPTCPEEQCESEEKHHFKRRSNIDLKTRKKLNNLCWETMFGQELVKMTVTDLVMTVLSTLSVDFFRAVFVRVMNNCWCWDLEKRFPQYGDFKIAENILHLVNNQGMVWMGMFFSPGLALINVVKLAVMMYLRSWAVLTCNVPHEVVFRASRSNNFYLALLLTMLFLCVLPVGYAVVRLTPSWHCGPFSSYQRTYIIFTESLRGYVPKSLHVVLDYVASPGIVIPLLLLLSLVIYYLISLTNSLREANNDLKIQLRRERTEERRRMFQLVERRRRGASGSTDLADKWKKLLPALPSTRDEESTIDQPTGGARPDNAARRKELLTRLLKHALRKSSATSDDESGVGVVDQEADGDGTDAEQPDSLPEDAPATKTTSKSGPSAMSQTVDQARKMRRQPSQPPGETAPPQPPQVTSPTVSSHREREDSVASAWSDNIPVIRISKTESTDCVVDLDQDDRNPTGSSDTVVAADELAAEEEKRERKKAVGRAIIQEARKRRDSAREDDAVKSETVKDDDKDTVHATTS